MCFAMRWYNFKFNLYEKKIYIYKKYEKLSITSKNYFLIINGKANNKLLRFVVVFVSLFCFI